MSQASSKHALTSEETKVDMLYREACAVTPGGVNTTIRRVGFPLAFTRASGAHMYDADGKDYLDYHAAFGAILLGHCHAAVNQQVAEVMGELDLVGVGTTPQEIQLAHKIVEHVPSAEMVHLCVTGTEATFHAIRVARATTGRRKIIKFQGCFHGGNDYVLMNVISPPEMLGKRDPGSAGMLPEVTEQTLIADFNDLDAVEDLFRTHPGEIAGVILEPIPHNVGCLLPEPAFLAGLRELTTQHGALLIFDEVITGFRHGLGGYQAIAGVTPDLTTMGKAMANGYPIAALAGRKDIMERFATAGGDVFFAGTYNAHPMSTVAALATIAELESGAVYEHIFHLGTVMREGLQEITDRLGIPARVSGYGSVFVVYFMDTQVRNYTDLLQNDEALYAGFHRGMSEQGIFMLPLNLKRNHISASHTRDDIDRTLDVAETVLRRVAMNRNDA